MISPVAAEDDSLPHRPEFQTTHWSVVLAAADAPSAEAHAALEQLCRTYWYPLYAFARREGCKADEAQDLTQAFFARILGRGDFATASRDKGRLRSFLLVALKHFLLNEWQRERAQKRGGNQTFIPLDEILAEERFDLEPADVLTADLIYERRWALTILEQVFGNLQAEYHAAGNSRLYDSLKRLLDESKGGVSQAQIAAELGMNENAVKQAFFRFRQRYRALLRAEIANTVAEPREIEEEMRYLASVLRQ